MLGYTILILDKYVETVLLGSDTVLEITNKKEDKLSRNLSNMYKKIRGSREFREFLNDLN